MGCILLYSRSHFNSREMPTYIRISCEELITLLDDLYESMNTEKAIEVWNMLVDDPCIIGHVDPYGVVYVNVCVADILDKVKLIKIPRAETVMESWDNHMD